MEAREDPSEHIEAGPPAPAVGLAPTFIHSGAFEAEGDETGQNITNGHQFEGSLHGDSALMGCIRSSASRSSSEGKPSGPPPPLV